MSTKSEAIGCLYLNLTQLQSHSISSKLLLPLILLVYHSKQSSNIIKGVIETKYPFKKTECVHQLVTLSLVKLIASLFLIDKTPRLYLSIRLL